MAVKRISPSEAKELLGQGYTYVDVRMVQEYDQGHPEGAVNAPINEPAFATVLGKAFAKDAKIVVGCKSGGRSQKAAMVLEAAGFTNLVEMRGGWGGDGVEKGWSALGFPGATAATPGGSWEELKKK